MSERIMRWFGDRRNETILDMTFRHLELTTKTVYQLNEMVKAIGDDPEQKQDHFELISRYELEADQIRREMIMELSKREIYPNERDDLMELVRAVDWIADWAHEASRIIMAFPFEKLPEEFRQSIIDMCKENLACVRVLAQCIHELSGNPKKALELADQVELFEGDLDDLYGEARNHLAAMDDVDLTRGALILVNELITAIETVSDWCENSADVARAIAIRVL
jgi:predicted phosphate transport protein (TIGR00153 family)